MPVGIVKGQYSPSPASFNSLIKLRMLLRCCLILKHHDTETLFILYLCPCLDLQLFPRVLRQTLVFMWNRALWEKFRFLFFRRFLLMLAGLSFLGGNKRWVIILVWSSEVFVVFPNFIRYLILSRRNRREETHILNFITNNYASFHLWWNEKYHQS